MAIGDDFTIDYVDKKITHTSGTTVYTANALYSYVQDSFDDLTQMDDQVPMSAQTPTEYTLINGWFMDDDSMQYLSNGAIQTNGWAGVIELVEMVAAAYTPAIASDIGKQVDDDGTEIGPLLAYNNTTRKWWVRTALTVDATSTMTITSGTGAGTSVGIASTNGEALWANVFTLGTIESAPSPQVYIFQDGEAIAEWSNLTNWDRGQIDVLIKVKESSVEIDEGNIVVYARQMGDLFDHFDIDLTAGGRNAVPLATQADLNNTTPDWYLLYMNELNGPFTANEVLEGWGSAATCEVSSITDDGLVGVFGIRGVKGTFVNGETISGLSSQATAKINGTIGDQLVSFGFEPTEFTTLGQQLGNSGNAAKAFLRGVSSLASGGANLVVQSNNNVQADSLFFVDYSDGDTITGQVQGEVITDAAGSRGNAGLSDVQIWFVNGDLEVTSSAGFAVGEAVSGSNGQSGVIVAIPNATGLRLANVQGTWAVGEDIGEIYASSPSTTDTTALITPRHTTTKAFQLQSAQPYDIIVDCNTRTLAETYEWFKYVTHEDSKFQMYANETRLGVTGQRTEDGEEYIRAFTDADDGGEDYVQVKASPLGTFAGGTLFGPQGLWVENMAAADAQAFQLIDSNGSTQNPPNFQSVVVTSVEVDDVVSVFRSVGGDVDKTIYTGNVTLTGAPTFIINSTVQTDTPSAGILRVVYASGAGEERFPYDSFAGNTFTLSATGAPRAFASGVTAYVPYIDTVTPTGSTEVSQTVIFADTRTVLVRVRQKGILPFETAGTFGANGLSVAAIRTTDTIVT
jgi:hypothetical protein